MPRVHPLACPFTDLNAAPDGADFDEEAGDCPPSTRAAAAPEENRGMLRVFSGQLAALGASLRTDVASVERGFSALAHADNNVSFLGSLPDEEKAAAQFSNEEEDEEAIEIMIEPAVVEAGPPATAQPQPTVPHSPCWKRISPARRIAKMRASSAPRRPTGESVGLLAVLLSPTNLRDLRVWLAAYISVADYGSDAYSISVRPIICCCPVGQR